jgi:hypothetical protein
MVQVVEPLKPWVRYPGKIFLVVTFATSENSHPTQSHEIEKHCYHPSASGGKRRLLHQEHKEYRWPVRSLNHPNSSPYRYIPPSTLSLPEVSCRYTN